MTKNIMGVFMRGKQVTKMVKWGFREGKQSDENFMGLLREGNSGETIMALKRGKQWRNYFGAFKRWKQVTKLLGGGF